MIIEELFANNEPFCEKQTSSNTGANKIDQSIPKTEKKPKNCKCKASHGSSAKSKQSSSTASKRRRPHSKMRLEQVNRHEEYSYLLEAETNQAILENIVCKDELCRFLSPLRFIEIDSWRREVPYGVKHEPEFERRKWKSPIEILYGGNRTKVDEQEESEKPYSDKKGKQKGLSSTGQTKSKLNQKQQISQNNRNQAEQCTENSTKLSALIRDIPTAKEKINDERKTNVDWSCRPATSPERKGILNKSRNEKDFLCLQTAPTVPQGLRSRPQAAKCSLALHKGFYDRTALAQPPARRTISASTSKYRQYFQPDYNENFIMNSVFKSQKMDLGYFSQNEQAINQLKTQFSNYYGFSNKTHLPSVRPRTRVKSSRNKPRVCRQASREKMLTTPVEKEPDQVVHQEKNQKYLSDNLSNLHVDPNIAYIPQAKTEIKNESRTNASVNFEVYSTNKVTPHNKSSKTETTNSQHTGILEDSIRLPLGSLFNSTLSPRVENNSPRFAQSNEPLTYRSWTSKLTGSSFQSPWVTQALPDFSNKDYSTKAERESFYARKSSKTVSFRMENFDYKKRKNRISIQNEENSAKKNISMVVVNVEEPCEASRSLLSPKDTIKLSQKANSFVTANVISVKQ